MSTFSPELLAPAGSLEKLIVAVNYGADAVYLGGQKFGLRQAADNFTSDEMAEGVSYAHKKGSKVFVVLNSFFHDKDFDNLLDFLKFLEEIEVDAVIVSDPGVISYIYDNTNLEIHLSTQASCLNVEAAKVWRKLGVKRVVLGREVSIQEASRIKKESGLEVEMFIHGSMCMAYSGHCVISNFTQGRDSNRGGCAHSCRFEYSIEGNDIEKKNAYFMSSKDLEGIRVLKEFVEYEIDSLKVEGRMKSHLYAGTISKVYREAIDQYLKTENLLDGDILEWENELRKITHRAYSQASLVHPADETSIYDEREHEGDAYTSIGSILEVNQSQRYMIVEVKSAFYTNDILEILPFSGKYKEVNCLWIKSIEGHEINKTNPGSLVKIPYLRGVERWNLVRRKNF